mgnify:CR=1 FL=1
MRALFKGLLHLATKYENRPKIIRLRGRFVPMDPRNWKTEYDVSVNVGLGTGQAQERMQALMMVLGKQEQLLQQLGLQNPVVSPNQYLNTLKQLVQLAGFKDSGQFFATQIDMQAMAQQQLRVRALYRELTVRPVSLTISASEAKVSFVDEDGETRDVIVNGKTEKLDLGTSIVECRATWEGAALTLELFSKIIRKA